MNYVLRRLCAVFLVGAATPGWAQVDCTVLDPRASLSNSYEGKISASVDTLYKIARAGGSVEGKISSEIDNLQRGVPVSDQTLIQLRTLYLFCGLVANAPDIPAERKIDLFQRMMSFRPVVAGGGNQTGSSAGISDFPSGSRRIYSANFITWPKKQNQDGVLTLKDGEYLIMPSSNAWLGPDYMPITASSTSLGGDFVLDAFFRVIPRQGQELGVELELKGLGSDPNYVNVTLYRITTTSNGQYSIDKGWLKQGYILSREKMVASDKAIRHGLVNFAARAPVKLTVKRDGGNCQVFINDVLLEEFAVTRFPLGFVRFAAEGTSTFSLLSVEVRTRQ